MRICVIGLGGVGSILIERLCRFLNYSGSDLNPEIVLVDGDTYEAKNYERQEFVRMGNKASIKAAELNMKFSQLKLEALESFVDPSNIKEIINDGNTVFLCVDNHKTRMIVSNYCKSLQNVTLISGGNELVDGNVQLYVRRKGNDLTPDLCKYHPEIANPDDKLPNEMSCEELSRSDPQLYFTNLGVATIMCWTFYNAIIKKSYERSEIYFDILTMNSSSKVRATN